MKTVGSVLTEARNSVGLSYEELSQRTHIKEAYLRALDQNQFEELPNGPFVRGFLRSYAIEVGLSPESVLAIYRRDTGSEKKTFFAPKALLQPLRKGLRAWMTPQSLGFLVVVAAVAMFLGVQWYLLTQPPVVVLDTPKEGQELSSPVVVRGKTATDARVTVNDQPVAVDQEGVFSISLEFDAGDQFILVQAANRDEKTRSVRRMVKIVE
jgi:cytoskeletal protein RodZ